MWGAPIYLGPIETPAAGGSKRPSAFGANAPCAQSEVYDSETMGYRCSLGVSSLHGSSPVALYEVFSVGVVDLRSAKRGSHLGTAAPLGPAVRGTSTQRSQRGIIAANYAVAAALLPWKTSGGRSCCAGSGRYRMGEAKP